MKAISVEGLVKDYPGVRAVDGISFEVERGEIFGMVGPNGAGKTTTIECIEGLRKPDGGTIRVLGLDPQSEGYRLREKIGVQLQATALYDRIRVHEALKLFASLYRVRSPWAKEWKGLVEPLGLADKLNSYYHSLSGGQKQRLHIALALVHDPEIVFLDELTTGLDPQARRAMWDLIRDIRDQGKTVFLTTHYMEEAEQLCDRVAIIDRGKIIALDSPTGLIAGLGGENRILFTLEDGIDPECFKGLPHVSRVDLLAGKVILYSSKSSATLMELIKEAEANGWALQDLHVQRATLEDVFLTLTGRELRE
jgi:ABC-2 type transport system ATP-binding protein